MYCIELVVGIWPGDSVDAEDLLEAKGGFSRGKRSTLLEVIELDDGFH